MSSCVDEVTCPKCGNIAFREQDSKTCEVTVSCPSCNKRRVRQDSRERAVKMIERAVQAKFVKSRIIIDRKLLRRQRIALYDAWDALKDAGLNPKKRIRLRSAIDGVTELCHCIEDCIEPLTEENTVEITIDRNIIS